MVSFGFNSETGGQFYSLIFPFTNIILWYKSEGKKYFFHIQGFVVQGTYTI